MALGLPPLSDEEIPKCGVPGLLRSCTRSGETRPPHFFFFFFFLTTPRNL